MAEAGDVYRRLQERLDELPVGYPATESGVELRILKRLFTPEEAEVALGLSAVPETVETIRHRLPGRTTEELERMLDRMVEKGAIFGGRMLARGGAKRYSRAPLVIGMYEAQVDRLTKELQQDFEQYAREGFATDAARREDEADADGPGERPLRPRAPGGPLRRRAGDDRGGRGPLGGAELRLPPGPGPPRRALQADDRTPGLPHDRRRRPGHGRLRGRPGAHPRGDARPPGPGRARRDGPPARERAGPALHVLLLRLLLRDAAGGEAVPEAGGVPPVQLPGGGGRGAVLGVRDLPRPLPDGGAPRGERRDRGGPRPLHRLRPVRAAPARATP